MLEIDNLLELQIGDAGPRTSVTDSVWIVVGYATGWSLRRLIAILLLGNSVLLRLFLTVIGL